MSTFSIGDRLVGPDQSTYFITDIADNHDGDLDRALQLMTLAKEAGADAARSSTSGSSASSATTASAASVGSWTIRRHGRSRCSTCIRPPRCRGSGRLARHACAVHPDGVHVAALRLRGCCSPRALHQCLRDRVR